MGFWDALGSGVRMGAGKAVLANTRRLYYDKRDQQFGGMTADEWDTQWQRVGTLNADFSHLSHVAGLYRAQFAGKIVYIGRAVEWSNGGLRKRLRNYTRDSDSSRHHGSGRLMNKRASELLISVLIVGSDENAADITMRLEQWMIGKHQPEWNGHDR
jgi:hypothetical protein